VFAYFIWMILGSLLRMMEIYKGCFRCVSNSIRMSFGISKCAKLTIKRGRSTRESVAGRAKKFLDSLALHFPVTYSELKNAVCDCQ